MKYLTLATIFISHFSFGMFYADFDSMSYTDSDSASESDEPRSSKQFLETVDLREDASMSVEEFLDWLDNLRESDLSSVISTIHSLATWKDVNSNTLLHYVFFQIRKFSELQHIVKPMIELGAKINAQNYAGQTPLHFLKDGIFAQTAICKYKADPSIKDAEGVSGMEAVFPYLLEGLYLIEYPEKALIDTFGEYPVNQYDSNGYTILHHLCREEIDLNTVKYFLEKGANPNAISNNRHKETALHLAASRKRTQERWGLYKLLRQYGADSALKNSNDQTAFDIEVSRAEGEEFLAHVAWKRIEDTKAMLESRRHTISPALKQEALTMATKKRDATFMELLFDHGAQTSRGLYCINHLHILAEASDGNYVTEKDLREIDKCIELCIKAGANINAQDPKTSKTPLLIAAEKGHTRTLQCLIARGANPNITDRSGNIPVYRSKDAQIVLQLLEAGARLDKNEKTIVRDEMEIVSLAINSLVLEQKIEKLKQYFNQGANIIDILPAIHTKWIFSNKAIQDMLILTLTHPLPGPKSEDKSLARLRTNWLTFLMSLKRISYYTKIPKDMRNIIRQSIFPPCKEIIQKVPTKKLTDYAPVYGAKKIIAELVANHLTTIEKRLNDQAISERARGNQSFASLHKDDPDLGKYADPAHIAEVYGPILEKNYTELLFPI